MRLKNNIILALLACSSLAYADCGPTPGDTINLSSGFIGGNYYLSQTQSTNILKITNDTTTLKKIRFCVAPTAEWWTTALNQKCDHFTVPSGDISIRTSNGPYIAGYSAGRCDAVVTLKPGMYVSAQITRLSGTHGTWSLVQ